MSVEFGGYLADATGEGVPSARALVRGEAFANSIPGLTETGFGVAAEWWATYIGGVFPLRVARPHPDDQEAKKVSGLSGMGSGGEWERPSRNIDQIREWWAVKNGNALGNIGFAPMPCGILVIDIDPRNGGSENWREFKEEHGVDDSECGRTLSPRGDGGRHLWWKLPDGVTYDHSSLAHGVDRPWQFPLPPSVRYVDWEPGSKDPARRFQFRPYIWQAGDPRDLPVAPKVLYGPGMAQPLNNDVIGQDGASSSIANGNRIGKERVELILRDGVIPLGEQSYQFIRITCSMIRRRYSDEQIISELEKLANRSPHDPSRGPWTRRNFIEMVSSKRVWMEKEQERERAEDAQFSKAARFFGSN